MIPALDYKPQLPLDRTMGIGIVGAGDIVLNAHLPAYRLAGFRVVGIFDIDRSKAQHAAEAFGIATVFESLEQLVSCSEVDIVDIAVPIAFQRSVVKEAVSRGKHVLCQKPLAGSMEEARDIAAMCAEAGVKAASNQQMRWSPGIQASRCLMRSGLLGTPLQGSIQVNVLTPWETWPWLARTEQLEVMNHSIHYIDSIRYVIGEAPEYIYADGARFPGQGVRGETRTLLHMKFPGEARGLVHDNHNSIMPPDNWYATFRFEGTAGVASGTNGVLYDYPRGREDTISVFSKQLGDEVYEPQLEGKWFPHAFMGTMGELMLAIQQNREPDNSVADNLLTIKTVFAAYRSMKENRPVYLAEMD